MASRTHTALAAAAAAVSVACYLYWRRRRRFSAALCCPPGSLPPLAALSPTEAPPKGALQAIAGMQVYVTGDKAAAKRAIVVAHDIWGFEAGRHRQVCDVLASRLDAIVYLPDFFLGDPCTHDKAPPSAEFSRWVKQWEPRRIEQAAEQVFSAAPQHFRRGIVGFCWGSFAAILAQANGQVQAAALVHPSHRKLLENLHGLSVQESDALIARAEGATLMLTANNDDERSKPGGTDEVLLKAQSVPTNFVEFPEMVHGWVIKGDVAASEAVARDVQAAVGLIVTWFAEHL